MKCDFSVTRNWGRYSKIHGQCSKDAKYSIDLEQEGYTIIINRKVCTQHKNVIIRAIDRDLGVKRKLLNIQEL